MRIAFACPPPSLFQAWSCSGGIPVVLRRMGHEAAQEGTQADLLLVSGPEHMPMEYVQKMRAATCLKAAWFQESMTREDRSFSAQFTACAQVFDVLLFPAAQDAEAWEAKEKGRCHWLPFGVDDQVFMPSAHFGLPSDSAQRDVGIGFLGLVYPKRSRFLEALRPHLKDLVILCGNAAVNDIEGVNVEDSAYRLALNLRRLKICLNLPALSQHNTTRVFEALSTCCCLVTPKLEAVAAKNEVLFEDGVHLVRYGERHHGGLAQVLRELLANDEARQKIAIAGCKEVREKHSLERRLEKILELAGLTPKPLREAVQPAVVRDGQGSNQPAGSPARPAV